MKSEMVLAAFLLVKTKQNKILGAFIFNQSFTLNLKAPSLNTNSMVKKTVKMTLRISRN